VRRTALHTAVLLHRAGVRVVGLTAPQRTGAAARAGVYDRVLAYDDVAGLDVVAGTVYADVAGRPEITAAVHRTLGTSLARSVRVGGTHAAAGATADLTPPPGPAIERFNVGQRRLDVAARRGEAALAALERAAHGPIAAWAAEHTTLERVPGLERAQDAWRRTWRGETDPFDRPLHR